MIDDEIDPSQNFLERHPHPLASLFTPQSVAVIGAKEDDGSVGRTILENLLGSFSGKVYPVNPKHAAILGKKAHVNVGEISEPVDLAIIITPPASIPDLIDECAAAKIPSVIVISAGFKEIGPAGVALEKDVVQRARKGQIRLLGPNCLGIMNPHAGLNATFAAAMALPGKTAFLSQSGALCTAVLDWSLREKIGFSAFVSVGSMADIEWGDLIDYLDHDPHTESILMYMETVGNARSFLSQARSVTLNKPIILIKPGRTQAAVKAAASHTGALAGADDVFDAAIERAGVLRVETIADLFNMAQIVGKQPRPKGANLAVVTNAGGPAVLATDAAVLSGAQMAALSQETLDRLSSFLPPAWSHNNPVDVLGDASAERYQRALQEVANDPGVDGLLVILTPQDMTESSKTAEAVSQMQIKKPLLASWMGAAFVEKGVEILNNAQIATYEFPDSASRAFGALWRQADAIELLYETPVLRLQVKACEEKIRAEIEGYYPRTLLTEAEAKKVLTMAGIPVVETVVVKSAKDAADEAERIGFPVVVKLHSTTITHKSDVGGVKLNLKSREEVAQAFVSIEKAAPPGAFEGVAVQKMVAKEGYELILGSMTDPQFGPVVVFGSGGELVEVYKDRALALPPLNSALARRLMQKPKIFKALQGVRGKPPVDLDRLEEILILFSELVVTQPKIAECDINPLVATSKGVIALDARIVLQKPDVAPPRPAIRPYPIQYVTEARLRSGKTAVIRPVRPEDEPRMILFHRELSEETVRQRYFGFLSLEERVAHERLVRICHGDFDREITLVVEIEGQIAGICRLAKFYGSKEAELKMVIVDRFQNQGVGAALVQRMVEVGKAEGVSVIVANILKENHSMIRLCEKVGFRLTPDLKNPALVTGVLLGIDKL